MAITDLMLQFRPHRMFFFLSMERRPTKKNEEALWTVYDLQIEKFMTPSPSETILSLNFSFPVTFLQSENGEGRPTLATRLWSWKKNSISIDT